MCFSAPQAPDPVATANAQNAINAQAIDTSAKYNQVNQVSPFGTQTYSGTPGTPDNTLTTALTPALQQLLTGQTGIAQGLTNAATSRLSGIPQDNFQLPQNPNGYLGAPQQAATLDYAANNPLQTSIANAGPIQRGLNYNPNIQGQVNNGDFGSQIQQAQNAAYNSQTQYLDPQFKRSDQSLESNLAAQGIPVGSEAWKNAMDQASEAKNQAYGAAGNAAVLAGNQEQNTLYGQQLASGNFANQAQNQGFTQALGGGTFANTAQSQQYGQNANDAQFYNNAQGQQFQQGMQLMNYNLAADQANNQAALAQGGYNQNVYQQGLSNQLQGRQENFNELASFLNGSPVSPTNPTFQPTATYNAAQASPDAVGLAGTNYNAAQQSYSGLLGSLFGALGTAGAAKICWVAREVYGTDTNRWMMFRHYLMTKAPAWFVRLYLTHGPRVALWLHDKPRVKALVRRWMDARIAAYV